MTDEQSKAKKRDVGECAKTLEERLASLDNALREFARSWNALGRTLPPFNSRSVLIGENELTVRNTLCSVGHIDEVLWNHLDAELIRQILLDIQEASRALHEAESGLRALGI